MTALEKYHAALRNVPQAGRGVHPWLMAVANFAAWGGVDAATAEEDLLSAMPRKPNPPGEVRDTLAEAYRARGVAILFGAIPCIPKPKPDPAPVTAANYIRKGDGATEADLWEASPIRIDWGEDWRLDAIALVRALFRPGELVFCGERHETQTVRTREEWCARWKRGEAPPPFLIVNPLKPGGGLTKSGKPSMRCDGAISAFRHAVVEFDEMPLVEQVQFWMGWGLEAVTAITFSGSKSLHALLRVDAASREEWDRGVRGVLFEKTLVPLGCDKTCKNPSRLSRLAGAWRADKGTRQRLLFVREGLK